VSRVLDKCKIIWYNYILKLYLRLTGGKMTFKAAVKNVLQYFLNKEMTKLNADYNLVGDAHRRTIINVEIIKLKELSDKLDESK